MNTEITRVANRLAYSSETINFKNALKIAQEMFPNKREGTLERIAAAAVQMLRNK